MSQGSRGQETRLEVVIFLDAIANRHADNHKLKAKNQISTKVHVMHVYG